MQGREIICVLMMVAAGCRTGFARLGETEQAMQARYGAPVSGSEAPGFIRRDYERSNFMITVYFQEGVSVLEKISCRGMDQDTALKVVAQVAGQQAAMLSPVQEDSVRRASGITCKDEEFWGWSNPSPEIAAFNPLECSISFFAQPSILANVRQALDSGPLAGS